jgi:hypothetical protein
MPPNYVDGPTFAIALQDQYAWPFHECRIFLYCNRRIDAGYDIIEKNIICGKLPKAVQRNTYLASVHEHAHTRQDIAHGTRGVQLIIPPPRCAGAWLRAA